MKFPPATAGVPASLDPMRDSFAESALIGMLARADLSADKAAAAATAYGYADAMIAERNKMQPAAFPRTRLDPIAVLSPQETQPFTPQSAPYEPTQNLP